jgi:hypothetical protein
MQAGVEDHLTAEAPLMLPTEDLFVCGWPRLGEPVVRYRAQYCYVAALLPGHRDPPDPAPALPGLRRPLGHRDLQGQQRPVHRIRSALPAPPDDDLVDAAGGHRAPAVDPEPQLRPVGLCVPGTDPDVPVEGTGSVVADLDDAGLAVLPADGDLPQLQVHVAAPRVTGVVPDLRQLRSDRRMQPNKTRR